MIEELIKYNKLLDKLHVIKKNKNFIFSNDIAFFNNFVMPMAVLIFSSVLIFVAFHNKVVAATGNTNDVIYYFYSFLVSLFPYSLCFPLLLISISYFKRIDSISDPFLLLVSIFGIILKVVFNFAFLSVFSLYSLFLFDGAIISLSTVWLFSFYLYLNKNNKYKKESNSEIKVKTEIEIMENNIIEDEKKSAYFLEHSSNEALIEKIIQHHTNNKSVKELVKEKLLKNENHIINL